MVRRWIAAVGAAGVAVVASATPALAQATTATSGPSPSARVSVRPDVGALPGGPQLEQMVNGIAAFALIIFVGSIVVGAIVWSAGSSSANYNQINGGKRTVILALVGAVIVGGGAALINFFNALGGQI